MKQALRKFQQISLGKTKDQKLEVLKGIYDETMRRIKEQKPGFRHLATNALSWLSHAKRQLKTSELQHALAVNMELDSGSIPEFFDADSIPEIDLIVSSCHGLVTVDEESDVIRLVHYTAQEYFDRMRRQLFPEAETTITNVCTLYLTMNKFSYDHKRGGDCSKIKEKLQLDPFFGYACVNWGYHACGADSSSHFIHDFLAKDRKVKTAAQAMCYIQVFEAKNDDIQEVKIVTALELTAYFGAIDLMKKLLSTQDTSLGAAELDRALFSALYNKQIDALRLLLDMGAEVGAKNHWGGEPLHSAAFWDDAVAARLLLDFGADLNALDGDGCTPLALAAYAGYTDVVQLLLERGASFIDQEDEGSTPVEHAMRHNTMTTIRVFLETVTDPKPKVYHLKNLVLEAAIFRSNIEAIKLVFKAGPQPNLKRKFGSKLLFWALSGRKHYKDIVELLLEKGAKPFRGELLETWHRHRRATYIDKDWLAQRIPSLVKE